jgi:hypothetical protein
MKGNIDLQQAVELFKKQRHNKNKRRNPYFLNLIQDYQFLPSKNKG